MLKCPHCGKLVYHHRRQLLKNKLIALADGTPRSIGELVALTGESRAMVSSERKKLQEAGHSLPLITPSMAPDLVARNKTIYEERKRDGTVYRELGKRYGISSSRIREIVLREWRRRCREAGHEVDLEMR